MNPEEILQWEKNDMKEQSYIYIYGVKTVMHSHNTPKIVLFFNDVYDVCRHVDQHRCYPWENCAQTDTHTTLKSPKEEVSMCSTLNQRQYCDLVLESNHF